MEWAGGYVADIGYTAGFYRETAPNHIAFAALAFGRSPGRASRPKRYLELGFGQGFGLSLIAAANPDIEFEGYDFNPEHVTHARRLIDGAGLTNVKISESSFEEIAARGGDNDVDVIVIHGIFSWVSRKAQDALIAIMRRRLQPDGVVYISYNTMPGWAPLAPLQHFMREVRRRNPGSSERQLTVGLELLKQLKEGGSVFFQSNPAAANSFDAMFKQNRQYLIHEYLDEHWEAFYFADLANRLGEAKLSFLTSATLLENLDIFAVPPALQSAVAQMADPMMREMVRDYAANRQFRRDIFARGTPSFTRGELRSALSGLSFALAVPRDQLRFKVMGPLRNELAGREAVFTPIADLLQEKNATFEELLALPALDKNVSTLLESLVLFVHSAQVMPFFTAPAADPEPAQRFNRMLVEHARSGRFYSNLASPVARSGVPVGEFGLLALAALLDGRGDNAEMAAQYALELLTRGGRRPVKDGKAIESDVEAVEVLAASVGPVLTDMVPIWRRLGVL